MTYSPHSITLPLELIVTARRTEDGECELDEITLGQFRFTLLWRGFNEDQLRQIRRLWLDAEEAAEKHSRELRSQP